VLWPGWQPPQWKRTVGRKVEILCHTPITIHGAFFHGLGNKFQHHSHPWLGPLNSQIMSYQLHNSGSISIMSHCYFSYSYKKTFVSKAAAFKIRHHIKFHQQTWLMQVILQSICMVQCACQLLLRILITAASSAKVHCMLITLEDNHQEYGMWQPRPVQRNEENLEWHQYPTGHYCDTHTPKDKKNTIPTHTVTTNPIHMSDTTFPLTHSTNSSASIVTWLWGGLPMHHSSISNTRKR
jgi:hypothetical protein